MATSPRRKGAQLRLQHGRNKTEPECRAASALGGAWRVGDDPTELLLAGPTSPRRRGVVRASSVQQCDLGLRGWNGPVVERLRTQVARKQGRL